MTIVKPLKVFSGILILCLLAQLSAAVTCSAQIDRRTEYLVKSVFLERFCRFIDWPSEPAPTNSVFTIGVIGKNPFNSSLEKTYSSQRIMDKPVQIKYLDNDDDISGIDLLFISETDQDRLQQILKKSKNGTILTIADTSGYGHLGVHINMFLENGQIRFEINNDELKKSGFTVSSLLLSAAKIVTTGGEQ